MALETEPKLGQVPRLRCSEAVRDGFEAENAALHRMHLSFTALGRFVSGFLIKTGSKWAQYQAPLPRIALVLTVTRPSYRLFNDLTVTSSVEKVSDGVEAELVLAIGGGSKGMADLGI